MIAPVVSMDPNGRFRLRLVRGDDHVFPENEIVLKRTSGIKWPNLTNALSVKLTARRNAPLGRDEIWFSVEDVKVSRVTPMVDPNIAPPPPPPPTTTLVFRPRAIDGTTKIVFGENSGVFVVEAVFAQGRISLEGGYIDGLANEGGRPTLSRLGI